MSNRPQLPDRDPNFRHNRSSARGIDPNKATTKQLQHKVASLEGTIKRLEEEIQGLRAGVKGEISSREIKACSNFLTHENKYVNEQLRKCYDYYLRPLQVYEERGQPIISREDMSIIFRNFDNIYMVHQQLYKEMIQTAVTSPLGLPKEMAKVLDKFVPHFKLYIHFLDQRDDAMARLKELYKDAKFVTWHEVQQPCAGRSLRHFLERPTKRLGEYLGYLMKTYASVKNKESQNAKNLINCAHNLKDTLDRIAHQLKTSRGRKNLIALSNRYGLTNLQTSSRWVVLKADCQSLFNHKWKDVELVICNDMVFTAVAGRGFVFGGLKWALSLRGLLVFHTLNPNQRGGKELAKFVEKYNTDHSFFIRNYECDSDTYVVSFNDKKICDACMIELRTRIEEHQEAQRQCNPFGLEKRLRGKKVIGKEKEEYLPGNINIPGQRMMSPTTSNKMKSNASNMRHQKSNMMTPTKSSNMKPLNSKSSYMKNIKAHNKMLDLPQNRDHRVASALAEEAVNIPLPDFGSSSTTPPPKRRLPGTRTEPNRMQQQQPIPNLPPRPPLNIQVHSQGPPASTPFRLPVGKPKNVSRSKSHQTQNRFERHSDSRSLSRPGPPQSLSNPPPRRPPHRRSPSSKPQPSRQSNQPMRGGPPQPGPPAPPQAMRPPPRPSKSRSKSKSPQRGGPPTKRPPRGPPPQPPAAPASRTYLQQQNYDKEYKDEEQFQYDYNEYQNDGGSYQNNQQENYQENYQDDGGYDENYQQNFQESYEQQEEYYNNQDYDNDFNQFEDDTGYNEEEQYEEYKQEEEKTPAPKPPPKPSKRLNMLAALGKKKTMLKHVSVSEQNSNSKPTEADDIFNSLAQYREVMGIDDSDGDSDDDDWE